MICYLFINKIELKQYKYYSCIISKACRKTLET